MIKQYYMKAFYLVKIDAPSEPTEQTAPAKPQQQNDEHTRKLMLEVQNQLAELQAKFEAEQQAKAQEGQQPRQEEAEQR